MTNFKPMLAASKYDPAKARFPLTVQPKLDGIRASVVDGKLISRNGKPIPNAYVRSSLECPEFEGLDGELIVGSPTASDAFRVTTSGVMSDDGQPDFIYYVFDRWNGVGGFTERHASLESQAGWYSRHITVVPYVVADSAEHLDKLEAVLLEQGYEGAILRTPQARYKFGRGTMNALDLVKLKRFVDFEAVVVGYAEEQHNGNVATANAFGRTERSTAKAGKTGKGTLGKLVCRRMDTPTTPEFGVGTGFNAADRKALWLARESLIGKVIKVKSFPIGAKDAPRFPVFLGFRHPGDMPTTTEV